MTDAAPDPWARKSNPTMSPTPRPPLTRRKSRREMPFRAMRLRMCISGLEVLRGFVDGRANTNVSGAPANVAGHRAIDVGVGRLRHLIQQRCGRHDLPRLAITALRHIEAHPGLLDRVAGRRA